MIMCDEAYGEGGYLPGVPNSKEVQAGFPDLPACNLVSYSCYEIPDPPTSPTDDLTTQIEAAKLAVQRAATIAALRTATLALDDLRAQQAELLMTR